MIGDKAKIGFNIGALVDGSPDLKEIEIWIAGQLVTYRDNIAHVPTVAYSAEYDAGKNRQLDKFANYFVDKNVEQIHQFILGSRLADIEFKYSDDMFTEHQFLDWGPNTDDVICFLVKVDDVVFITAEFLRKDYKPLFIAQISIKDFRSVLLAFSQALRNT